ncbi:MAG: hypothetical protein ACI4GD_02520 [Lachnospiraceae bacterium]
MSVYRYKYLEEYGGIGTVDMSDLFEESEKERDSTASAVLLYANPVR